MISNALSSKIKAQFFIVGNIFTRILKTSFCHSLTAACKSKCHLDNTQTAASCSSLRLHRTNQITMSKPQRAPLAHVRTDCKNACSLWFCGRSNKLSGVFSSTILPSSIKRTRVEQSRAKRISCVTISIVTFCCTSF